MTPFLDFALKNFRQAHHLIGGCLIVWGDDIQAWQEGLLDPHAWRPGAVAYFEDGRAFRAIGGNDQKGADTWEELTTA